LHPQSELTAGKSNMLEYETFAYLDVQKTASTFIAKLLQGYCTEKKIRQRAHAPVGASYDPSKFYFISVRDPLDQYISLYSYGCKASGAMYWTLHEKGMSDLYNSSWRGFRHWLDFVLDPENAGLVSRPYAQAGDGRACQLIGLQSFRLLNVAVPRPGTVLEQSQTKEALALAYRQANIADFTVRYENLRESLSELIRTKLRHAISNLEEALAYAASAEPKNTSDRIDKFETDPRLGGRRTRILHEREWLLHEVFGY
jgi:hypothetical protein